MTAEASGDGLELTTAGSAQAAILPEILMRMRVGSLHPGEVTLVETRRVIATDDRRMVLDSDEVAPHPQMRFDIGDLSASLRLPLAELPNGAVAVMRVLDEAHPEGVLVADIRYAQLGMFREIGHSLLELADAVATNNALLRKTAEGDSDTGLALISEDLVGESGDEGLPTKIEPVVGYVHGITGTATYEGDPSLEAVTIQLADEFDIVVAFWNWKIAENGAESQ